jgi:hydrogenase expression/formation protein HypE
MSDLGKVDREFFDKHIYPNLGAEREDVRLAPQHGVDFGVVDVGEQVLALATDPVFIMPSLGFDRAAWFAFHILMSDVAVSGLSPTHLSIDLNLPSEITDEEFATVWKTMHEEAEQLGVAVVTGHTGRYAGCNYPMVGGGTALAVGSSADLVRPDGARAGDDVIVTKGPAIEATGLLSIQFEEILDIKEKPMEAAKDRFYDMSPVEDALVAAAAGPVTAMHDATEGGIYGGLHEIARAGGVQIHVERESIPVLAGVEDTCEAFGIDPWISISEGTLLLTVEKGGGEDVVGALESEGIPAAIIGETSEGEGVYFDGEPVERPERDPFWAAFEEGMEKLEDEK